MAGQRRESRVLPHEFQAPPSDAGTPCRHPEERESRTHLARPLRWWTSPAASKTMPPRRSAGAAAASTKSLWTSPTASPTRLLAAVWLQLRGNRRANGDGTIRTHGCSRSSSGSSGRPCSRSSKLRKHLGDRASRPNRWSSCSSTRRNRGGIGRQRQTRLLLPGQRCGRRGRQRRGRSSSHAQSASRTSRR